VLRERKAETMLLQDSGLAIGASLQRSLILPFWLQESLKETIKRTPVGL